jgi:hypothetical protein
MLAGTYVQPIVKVLEMVVRSAGVTDGEVWMAHAPASFAPAEKCMCLLVVGCIASTTTLHGLDPTTPRVNYLEMRRGS